MGCVVLTSAGLFLPYDLCLWQRFVLCYCLTEILNTFRPVISSLNVLLLKQPSQGSEAIFHSNAQLAIFFPMRLRV
jgi:hypothetical protein